MQRGRLSLTLALVAAAIAAACEGTGDPAAPYAPSRGAGAIAPGGAVSVGDDPLDPQTCQSCHQDHVRQWSGSMHAYASDDPVFVAMNARGQRETGGALGGLCVRCHAPLAYALGLTKDGTDLAKVPRKLRGVTCTFCHTVDSVTDAHDGALHLSTDGALRGAIAFPIASSFHTSSYSPLHDRTQMDSASLCGACHDVRNAAGVDVERTYAEWQSTIFAQGADDLRKTCGRCHMAGTHGPAATVPGAPIRIVHDHTMAALDLALTPFPEADAQSQAVKAMLDPALSASLCVTGPGQIQATLTNTGIGHAWPSGAAHDRRAWLEVVAFTAGAQVWSSGVTPNGGPPDPVLDPTAVLMRETLLDRAGAPVPFLWQAADVRSSVLLPVSGTDPPVTHPKIARFTAPPATDRVTMRVRVTPLGPDVASLLVASGDLDSQAAGRVTVHALTSTTLEWTADRGFLCLP